MNKYLIFVILITTPANAVSLLVQTEGGTVSIVKDLDAKTCKIAACRLKLKTYCASVKCDENGELKINEPTGSYSTCSIDKSYPILIECLE